MELLFTIVGFLIGGFLGFLGSFAANQYGGALTYILQNRFKKKWLLPAPIHLLENNIYTSVNSYEVTLKDFSKVAISHMEYLDEKLENVIITNTKEPWWFYSQFDNNKFAKARPIMGGLIKELSKKFENYTLQSRPEFFFSEVQELLNSIYNAYYCSGIRLFGHQKILYNRGGEKVRFNIFDVIVESDGEKLSLGSNAENFFTNNKPEHLLVFETIFSKGIVNYLVHPYHFDRSSLNNDLEDCAEFLFCKGTDALILNNEYILNHDDTINLLNYQRFNLSRRKLTGYFHRVIDRSDVGPKTDILLQRYFTEREIELMGIGTLNPVHEKS